MNEAQLPTVCENNDNFYKFSNIYIYISYVYRIKKTPSRYKTKSSCLNQNELTGASNTWYWWKERENIQNK